MSDEVREGAMEGAIDHGRSADSREVEIVNDGEGQTIRIPREFALDGARATIRRDGDRLVIESTRENDLLAYLRGLDPADRDFPDVGDDELLPLDVPDLQARVAVTVRYMIDTNVLSALVRDPYGSVAERFEQAGMETTCCSIVVAAELRYGIIKNRSMRQRPVVEGVLSRMSVFPLDEPADKRYAELRADLERRGEVIGPNDLLIAAHALSLDLTLVTDNVGEFRRVRDLRVENWIVRSASG